MSFEFTDVITVEVTRQDIDSAVEDSRHRQGYSLPLQCPVAKALTRITGESWAVGGLFAFVIEGNHDYDISPELQAWIKEWDMVGNSEPITSTITRIPA